MAKRAPDQLPAATRRELARITRGIPAHLRGSPTKEVIDTSQEDEARKALKNPELDPKTKRRVARMIAAGKFRTSEVVVDDAAVAALDQYHDQAVKRAIREGRLPDPKTDPFIRERAWRERNGR